jgi:hypothetical protein
MRVQRPINPGTHMPRIIGNILPHESRALFEQYLPTAINPLQAALVQQILAQTQGRVS